MTSSRGFLAVAVILLSPVLVACGADDEPEDSPPSSSSPDLPNSSNVPTEETSATSQATTDAPVALPEACDVLTTEEVAAAFGVEFGVAEPGGGGTNEGDTSWQSDNCDWEAEDLVEVQLALSAPEDYTPAFTCPEPTAIASTVEPVPGLGDAAYWEVDKSPPLEASLRVCTASYNFDIDLEYADGVDFQGDPQQQSIALAGVVLAKVAG